MSLDFILQGQACEHCGRGAEPLFEWMGITHNLVPMAQEAGIYECLWRPDEHGFTKASHVAQVLEPAIANMEKTPERFRALNPENDWGTYEGFMAALHSIAAACRKHPEAEVSACI